VLSTHLDRDPADLGPLRPDEGVVLAAG
jgi:hypothetical protein